MNKLIEGRPAIVTCTAPMLCNRETPKITWRGPKWVIPSGFYHTKCTSNDSQTIQGVVLMSEAYNYNFTITCVSSNYLGKTTKTFKAQNLTRIFNRSNELNSNDFISTAYVCTTPAGQCALTCPPHMTPQLNSA
ncbi:hypothetical protein WMY93_024105 [Mugilogobius chulae]|uniref:Ig-like domain-containing protein n=1 Tax=Mugilogobius chulae TaxID=88201 RepID=A0AAW0NIF3_9GOBI